MLFLVPFYAALSSFVLTITLYLGMKKAPLSQGSVSVQIRQAHVTHSLHFLLLSVFFWLAELIFSLQPITG